MIRSHLYVFMACHIFCHALVIQESDLRIIEYWSSRNSIEYFKLESRMELIWENKQVFLSLFGGK